MEFINFSETLKDLIFDKGQDAAACAREMGIEPSTLTRFMREERAPLTDTLIKIADYFKVSCDFLLGLAPESPTTVFNECPPFAERIKYLSEGCKVAEFCRKVNITTAQYYKYLHGVQPTVYSICKIAKSLDRSVDFVLGREK